MKKLTAAAMVLVMLFAVHAPAFAAGGTDAGLEPLILKVKAAIGIPESYEMFDSGMRTEDGMTYWSLNWSEKPNDAEYNNNSISAQIRGDGFITSYSKYDSARTYSPYIRLPGVSREDAANAVKAFIAKVCPEASEQVLWAEPDVSDGDYHFNFSRAVNGIAAAFNTMRFTVNGETGEVSNYYAHWDPALTFPAADGAISLEEAERIYQADLPLDLEYTTDAKGGVTLRYAPSREKSGYYIDAVSGEIAKPPIEVVPMTRAAAYADNGKAISGTIELSPAEREEADAVAGLITAGEAEAKLRAVNGLEFDESYKYYSAYLNRSKSPDGETLYFLGMSFTKDDEPDAASESEAAKILVPGQGNGGANASFNAKTGELTSFSSYIYRADDGANGGTYDRENGKKTAEEFIAAHLPKQRESLKYIDSGDDGLYYQYYRVENGAYFGYDGVTIGVNADTGNINRYNFLWEEHAAIPSVAGAIGLDKAHEALFAAVGLNMAYILIDKTPKLVYRLSDGKPPYIDAMSGTHTGYDGKPFQQNAAPEYGDLAAHFAEDAVRALVNVGVFLDGGNFMPDSEILQKDYVNLLSRLGGGFYRYGGEEEDEYYRYMLQNGIMDAVEKNPDGGVTREDAVKFLLRCVNYKKFAEIPGIFHVEFLDAADLAPELAGYAAIAKGLGIVSGSDGYFYPKGILTRGEAAVIIYNCLNAGF
ncbi:MAG: S-layer homology domain-containing protein [Clostridiales bacterium]|jgi:hypothetical protein|nr:S-layer homology domain-containing protein [Clostridiales bacterium]